MWYRSLHVRLVAVHLVGALSEHNPAIAMPQLRKVLSLHQTFPEPSLSLPLAFPEPSPGFP